MLGYYEQDKSIRDALAKIDLVRKHLSGFDEFENLGARRKDRLCLVIADKLTLTGADSHGIVIEEAKFVLHRREL